MRRGRAGTRSPRPHWGQGVRSRAHGKDLVDPHPAVPEGHLATDEVEPPHPGDLLADQLDDPVDVRLEDVDPCRDGADVVLPHRVHVTHLEPGVLEALDGLAAGAPVHRSEEHTSDLQSLMRHPYAVYCLKKKTQNTNA